MSKLFSLAFLYILIINNASAAIANCSGGECEMINSYHYSYVKTHCLQNLNFEEVKTDYLYFVISKTGQRCTVIESDNEN